ncbi:carbonic anhydrase [Aphanizomenon sp. CS-733/32]|uniref:carbonic anhydrase n=1 Tax=Aphanizomenon sp. CS-733/32 TaxID=3021715 RepID=UPI00232CE742|nr:carbonic anhydrase [Aphanizomenon sp. CS-733/32]MDB9309491.1 carbonic anhydrase [Aphanizomenon sp. CS-733/32]
MSRINGFVGRRNFLKFVGLSTLSMGTLTACNEIITNRAEITIRENNPNPNPVSAEEAKRRLIAGNRRFVNQNRQYPNQSKRRLQSLSKKQYPYAAILGCADSRVPPEIIFDQGLGDLFVVRVAGNIATNETIGSLEYATANLGTQLIVVLGHKGCGAVSAAFDNQPDDGKIKSVVDDIRPSLSPNSRTRRNSNSNDVNDDNNAVINNIEYQARKLQDNSQIIDKLIRDDRLKIVGAYYDINTGKVRFLT